MTTVWHEPHPDTDLRAPPLLLEELEVALVFGFVQAQQPTVVEPRVRHVREEHGRLLERVHRDLDVLVHQLRPVARDVVLQHRFPLTFVRQLPLHNLQNKPSIQDAFSTTFLL